MVAFASMAWNTGSSSPGERLVTLTGELRDVGLCFVVVRGWIA
jgi:hypothetical protein